MVDETKRDRYARHSGSKGGKNMTLKLIPAKEEVDGKMVEVERKLGNLARAQFEEWQTHAPTKDLKSADGGIVYLRLGDIRDEQSIDSRAEMTLVAGAAGSGAETKTLESIPDIGLINAPRVAHDKLGWYVVAGRRRLQFLATILDSSTIIQCSLQAGTRADHAVVSLIENVGRAQLTVPALADALYRIERETKMPRQTIAERSGFSPSHVSNLLNVRGYLTAEEAAKWRLNPKAIDLKSAISRIASAEEEAKKAGKKAAHLDLFETSGAAARAPEEKERAKRASKIQTVIRDHGRPNHVIGLEQATLSPQQQLDLIMRGYYLAMGEDEGIVLQKLDSGDVVASVLQKKDSSQAPAPAPSSNGNAIAGK